MIIMPSSRVSVSRADRLVGDVERQHRTAAALGLTYDGLRHHLRKRGLGARGAERAATSIPGQAISFPVRLIYLPVRLIYFPVRSPREFAR
jgi:hypothetical protein